MGLVLVTKSLQGKQETIRKIFGKQGGSIGRSDQNDWVLPDPQRYVSSQHAVIKYENSDYFLIDISSNGIYLNDGADAIAKGCNLKLHHGDRIYIGEYEVFVEIEVSRDAVIDEAEKFSSIGVVPDAYDPLKNIIGGRDEPSRNANESGIVNDAVNQATSLNECLSLAEVEVESLAEVETEGQIPDNWALTQVLRQKKVDATVQKPSVKGEGAVSPLLKDAVSEKKPKQDRRVISQRSRLNTRVTPPVAKEKVSKDSFIASNVTESNGEYDRLLQALGIDRSSIPPELAERLPEVIGGLTRECISGLMGGLMARASMKSAFRIEQTMIQPVGNNPLKFSVSVDEALESMFLKKGSGYLSSLDAVKEGFNDVKAHQLAIMAGMQGALQDMLRRFEPEVLEEQCVIGAKNNILFSSYNKNKYWDHYKELHEEVSREAQDNFQSLLGEGFVKAYEEQMQKMKGGGRRLKTQSTVGGAE